jgi:hypothetical protein
VHPVKKRTIISGRWAATSLYSIIVQEQLV